METQRPFAVGLTGGIASGKSVVAAMFAKLGARLIDTDVIARAVVAPGESGLEAVRATFGDAVFAPSGALDRRALRALVFADEQKRRELENLLHPAIRARTQDELARSAGPYAIVAVPLLVETDFGELVDRVLVVDCSPELQLERLIKRDGLPRADALAMIRAQTDRATRLKAADDVLENGGSLADVQRQVERLHRQYLELAARRAKQN